MPHPRTRFVLCDPLDAAAPHDVPSGAPGCRCAETEGGVPGERAGA